MDNCTETKDENVQPPDNWTADKKSSLISSTSSDTDNGFGGLTSLDLISGTDVNPGVTPIKFTALNKKGKHYCSLHLISFFFLSLYKTSNQRPIAENI